MKINSKSILIMVLTLVVGGAAATALSSLGAGVFWSSVASSMASIIGGHINNHVQVLSAIGKSNQANLS